jgi:hypothetical protein
VKIVGYISNNDDGSVVSLAGCVEQIFIVTCDL